MRNQVIPADRSALLKLLKPLLPRGGQVVLFGSRARGDAGPYSDIDLAVRAAQPIESDVLASMRERAEQSNVPYRVDVIDYARTPKALRDAIDKDGIEWTD